MFKLEFLIILVGLSVFILQNKIRSHKTETSSKIVYWTIMFFISLSFNTILFTRFGDWYNLKTYLTLNTLIIIIAITLGYFLIQALSPFKYFKKLIKSFKSIKNVKTDNIESLNKETKYIRQAHFEIFLETICWIGFISIFALEGYFILFNVTSYNFIEKNFVFVLCLITMITLPITLRQILFYLFNVRSINKNSLSKEELYLNEKLQKTNMKL